MNKWLNLVAGGIAGTMARYVVSGGIYSIMGTDFPYGTLAVNLIGCFIIGFLAALSEEKFLLGPDTRLLLMAGFCGAFTTFSTFMLETSHLLKEGETLRAFLNVTLSLFAGFIVFKIGASLGELI